MSTRKDRKPRGEESLYTSANSSVIELDSTKDNSVIVLDDSVIPLDNTSIENTFLAGGDTNMNPMHSFRTPMKGGASDSKDFINHEMVTSTPAQPVVSPQPTTPSRDNKQTTPDSRNSSSSKRKRAESPDSSSGREDEAFDETEFSQDELTEGTPTKPLPSDSVISNESPEQVDTTLVKETSSETEDKTAKDLPQPAKSEKPSEEGMYDSYTGTHLPLTVTLLTTPDGARVYVVGTAHFSHSSQEDVAKMIQLVKPQVVCLELCKTRTNILSLDEKTILEEAKNINFEKIRMSIHEMGLMNGLMYVLLLNMSAHLTKRLGMAPGGEFRRAVQEVKLLKSNCVVHLGDRPLNITIQRAFRSLSWWQTVKLSWNLVWSRDPISKEEVERCKQRDLLEEMLKEIAGEFPQLGMVFVQERDIFLTHSLQVAATSHMLDKEDPEEPTRVVAVVGIGHVPGIVSNWGKVSPADIPPLLHVPPPSRSSVLLKLTLKASMVGLAVWVVARQVHRLGITRLVRPA